MTERNQLIEKLQPAIREVPGQAEALVEAVLRYECDLHFERNKPSRKEVKELLAKLACKARKAVEAVEKTPAKSARLAGRLGTSGSRGKPGGFFPTGVEGQIGWAMLCIDFAKRNEARQAPARSGRGPTRKMIGLEKAGEAVGELSRAHQNLDDRSRATLDESCEKHAGGSAVGALQRISRACTEARQAIDEAVEVRHDRAMYILVKELMGIWKLAGRVGPVAFSYGKRSAEAVPFMSFGENVFQAAEIKGPQDGPNDCSLDHYVNTIIKDDEQRNTSRP